MMRIALVVSHPIQHLVPQYSSWAEIDGIEFKVFFASKQGLIPYVDQQFNRTVSWDLNMNFAHEFLNDADTKSVNKHTDSTDLNSKLSLFDPHLLIVYGYSQKLQRRAIAWGHESKTPICMISDSELHAKRNFALSFLKKIFLPSIYSRIDFFLTVGDSNETYHRLYGGKNHQFVRCSFPIERKSYDAAILGREITRKLVREKLNIPNEHKVVIQVGKLTRGKRPIDLIHFSNLMQTERDDITVILAGTGVDEEELKSQSGKIGPGGVVFAGFVNPSELPGYYLASDVYAHCSERDAHSLAISEAIYCGKPIVISSRCGSYGPTDDVRNGHNGWVYPCGDIAEFKRCLLNLFDNRIGAEHMGQNSTQIGRHNQQLAHSDALKQLINLVRHRSAL